MKKLAVAAASIALVAALTGCSASGAAAHTAKPTAAASATAQATQTHAQACTVVMDKLRSLSSMQSDLASAMTDPAKAQAMLDTMASTFTSMDSSVTNPEVKAKTSAVASAFTDYATYIKKVQATPSSLDTNELTAKLKALSSASTAVGQECAGGK
ncbi:hypothetical protein [Leifsonia sp. AG29]|uniref:hypothetical protein n=1 Tax=Leifsonia sp. AG29 TaxID=2598860 RepID=UPI00131CFDFF|nr:hypothetical protein [Leifsonia sp. AG29]